jgi:hypothetical protein
LDESASKPEVSQHTNIKINKLLLKENERRGAGTRKHQTKNVMITWAHMYLKEKQTLYALYACLKPIASTGGSARSLISIAPWGVECLIVHMCVRRMSHEPVIRLLGTIL